MPRDDGRRTAWTQVVAAPDLDGDGIRDLIVVSRFNGRNLPASRPAFRDSEPQRVYVDALSGRDGHPLWSWHADVPDYTLAIAGRRDGGASVRTDSRCWPISLGGELPDGPRARMMYSQIYRPTVHVLEASTGRELHRAMGLSKTGVADLDGDGLTDLWGEADGQLRAFRGEPPEAWRALGQYAPAWKRDPPGVRTTNAWLLISMATGSVTP